MTEKQFTGGYIQNIAANIDHEEAWGGWRSETHVTTYLTVRIPGGVEFDTAKPVFITQSVTTTVDDDEEITGRTNP